MTLSTFLIMHHIMISNLYRIMTTMKVETDNYVSIEVRPVGLRVMIMLFNATFNNISVISWRSVLLVEETGEPGENRRPTESH